MKAEILSVRGQEIPTTKVLVVSDQDMLKRRIAAILRNAGFGVISCSEGMEVMERLDENPCDVAVLDEGLPNCRLICHQMRNVFHVPVILLGNHCDDDYWHRADAVGPDAYVSKTISRRELVAWMRAILRRYAHAV